VCYSSPGGIYEITYFIDNTVKVGLLGVHLICK
jgi:hypothetical protein